MNLLAGTIKPQRREDARTGTLLFLSAVLVLLVFAGYASPQKSCKVASETSFIVSKGANEIIEYNGVQKRSLRSGRVLDANGEPILTAIVDVFPASTALKEATRIRSYTVDEYGYFCLGDIPDGRYWLRFGTEFFAFKHLIMRVDKKRSASSRPIEVQLEVGT